VTAQRDRAAARLDGGPESHREAAPDAGPAAGRDAVRAAGRDGGRDATGAAGPAAGRDEGPRARVRQRGFFEVRWRQFRNAPRPIVRAVLGSLVVAVALGLPFLAYDVALSRGVTLPGGDLRALAILVLVTAVLVVGSVVTYLIVPQPTGHGSRRVRSRWSAALGFFAAVPIVYLVLVVENQLLKPLFV
jgi:hypothetical protein